MFNIQRQQIEWGGRQLTLETGRVARQADGAVLVTYGDTVVLCTVAAQKEANPDVDFFPLTVNYQEKYFSAGKIPGGFLKREGRPSDRETLTCRLIDRPIRPLFLPEFRNECQIICTVLSYDRECESDIVALIGASAALTISGVPFLGPIGAARVGYQDGKFILNPSVDQLKEIDLDLVVAGTTEGVLMVESEAKELSEQVMLDAVNFGHEQFQPVIKAIIALAESAAKEPWEIVSRSPEQDVVQTKLRDTYTDDVRKAYKERDKQKRVAKLKAIKDKALEDYADSEDISPKMVSAELKALEKEIVRSDLLKTKERIDGRDTTTVRPIVSEVGIFPRTHGSALFTRGETQAMVVATLGTGKDEQFVDSLAGEIGKVEKSAFMLHYNFPPFSVGETGRVGGTSRREIGHGKLAWRSIRPLLPSAEDFPYTLRIVSDITESNGSSSMATVCGSSLALMDAGIPISRPAAGIAMGLIKEGDDYVVLSDILGDEDHLGDMDFKVAGTDKGITSLQMDIKITSITREIMEVALKQAREGRLHILGEMNKILTKPRDDLNANAPRILIITVPKDKIGEIIGPGGSNIRKLCEETGATIDIEEEGNVGKVRVGAVDSQSAQAAKERIEGIIAEPEVGQVYKGKVVGITDFGAFVNFLGARDGLVHISELDENRVEKVSDIVKVDDKVTVKCIGVDNRGKVKLTMKGIKQTA